MELQGDQGTLCFQMKLYDSKTYTDFMVHRISYHSAIITINAIVCTPESAPSLFLKPPVLDFALLNDLNCSRTAQPHSLGDLIFIILKRFPSIPF